MDMTGIRRFHIFRSLLALSFLIVSFGWTGCIKEDLDDCPQNLTFGVRVLDAAGADITSDSVIKQGFMYIFNDSGHLLGQYDLSREWIVKRMRQEITYNAKSLQFVFYGNPTEAMVKSLSSVTTLDALKYRLQSSQGIAGEAPDLFYGTLSHRVKYGDVENVEHVTVDVRRITAMVHVTVLGYRDWMKAQMDKDHLTFADGVHGLELSKTPDTHQGLAKLVGDFVNYRPEFKMDSNGNIATDLFRIYPTLNSSPLAVNLFGGNHIYLTQSASSDDNKQFIPVVGKTLNILIRLELDTSISVVVAVSDWNVVYQFVEY